MAQDHWQSLSKNCCKTRYFYLLTGQQKTKSHFKVMIKQKCRKSGISPCCHNRELLTHTEHFIVYLMQTALQSRHISTLDCNYDKSLSALDKRKLVSKIHKTIFLFFFFFWLKDDLTAGKMGAEEYRSSTSEYSELSQKKEHIPRFHCLL